MVKRKNKWTRATVEGRANLKRLEGYLAQKLSHKEIGKIFGVEEGTINSIVCRSGVGVKRNSIDFYAQREMLPPSTAGASLSSRVAQITGHSMSGSEVMAELSDEELAYYTEHLSEFAKKYVYWAGEPVKLDEKQCEVIDSPERFEIWNKSARVGISWSMALRTLLRAVFYPGTTALFVSVKEDRAKELLNSYIYHFAQSPVLQGCIVSQKETSCVFDNDSDVYSLTASASGARGIPSGVHAMEIYLDELAHYKPGQDNDMWTALSRNFPLGASMRIWSTPGKRGGTFYELWEKTFMDKENFGFVGMVYNWRDCPRISAAEVMQYRKTVGDIIADQEYENKFTDVGETLFPYDVIDGHMIPRAEFVPGHPVFIGVDFAMGGGDLFAVVVTQKIEDTFFILEIKQYNLKHESQVLAVIQRLYDKYEPVRIYGDKTGMGIPLCDALQRELGACVEGVAFSNLSKDQLIMNLWNNLHNDKLWMPKDKSLLTQLSNLGVNRTATGGYSYVHRSGYKDDLVWALALSLNYMKPEWNGFMDIGTSGGSRSVLSPEEIEERKNLSYRDARELELGDMVKEW